MVGEGAEDQNVPMKKQELVKVREGGRQATVKEVLQEDLNEG